MGGWLWLASEDWVNDMAGLRGLAAGRFMPTRRTVDQLPTPKRIKQANAASGRRRRQFNQLPATQAGDYDRAHLGGERECRQAGEQADDRRQGAADLDDPQR
jgi:hypothetical protein